MIISETTRARLMPKYDYCIHTECGQTYLQVGPVTYRLLRAEQRERPQPLEHAILRLYHA